MKKQTLLLVFFGMFLTWGQSFAGELFITSNINLKTRDIHRIPLRDVLRLENGSDITSIFVLASTSATKAELRVLWNGETAYEHGIGPNLKMIRFDTSYQLGESDSLDIEFDAEVEAVTVGVILQTEEEGSRAITIHPGNSRDPRAPGEPRDPEDRPRSPERDSVTDAELEGFIDDLLNAFWDDRRMDVVFQYVNYFFHRKELSMIQLSRVLRTFREDIFRIEALQALLRITERSEEDTHLVVQTFYHPQAKADASYLLERHIRAK